VTRWVSWVDLFGPDPDDHEPASPDGPDERCWSHELENTVAFDVLDIPVAA